MLVRGDQLNVDNPALDAARNEGAPVLMIERRSESQIVWSSKPRSALFLAAMRHHAAAIRSFGLGLDYVDFEEAITEPFFTVLARKIHAYQASQGINRLVVCEPGEYRMLAGLQDVCAQTGLALDLRVDTHFLCSSDEFAAWAGDKKHLLMEYFYRQMRKKTGVLMQADGEPEGGRWNFDAENRKGYPKSGPSKTFTQSGFPPDALTQSAIDLVARTLPDHPGSLNDFRWPVTRAQALVALQQFVDERLAQFGDYQDAMWTTEPFGAHALIASSLNLKLISPREVVDAALHAYQTKGLPLASVEGFVRQIIGWREFIRGVYWRDAPHMREANHFGHTRPLPAWFWSGETQMQCLANSIGQTLQFGYAHHIQRLMVIGNFSLLAGLLPQEVEDWFLAVYVDAVEWVELPNVAGMALYANGGRFTSKPYIASGQYIKRMSNYCGGCRYRPELRTGPHACPITTLYWNFLDRHESALLKNMRTVLMAKSVQRLSAEERASIRAQAQQTLENIEHL